MGSKFRSGELGLVIVARAVGQHSMPSFDDSLGCSDFKGAAFVLF